MHKPFYEIESIEKKGKEKVCKENTTHGSSLFPCACYDSWLLETYPSINLHWHPELEFNLVVSGKAEAIINFESHIVNEGDIIIINKDEVHGFFRYKSQDFNCKAVVFHLDLIGGKIPDELFIEFIAPLANKEKQFINIMKSDNPVYDEFKKVLEEIFRLYEDKQSCSKLLLKAKILETFYLLFSSSNIKNGISYSKRNVSMKKAIDFIAQNYTRHISAEEAAAIAGYSKYHFLRIFKEAVGIEFTRYVNQVRFEHAILLLKESNLSITEIAQTTGFSDSAYFTKRFKEEYHTTPLSFRKNAYRSASILR